MKIFTGEKPKNPNKISSFICRTGYDCYKAYDEGQLSILNQCVEVREIEDIVREYVKKHWVKIPNKWEWSFDYPLEQFIQSEIKKEEGKDEG
jgi:hypothetical protein